MDQYIRIESPSKYFAIKTIQCSQLDIEMCSHICCRERVKTLYVVNLQTFLQNAKYRWHEEFIQTTEAIKKTP